MISIEGSSFIMDQLVIDTEYFIITEEGVLTIVPGSLGGISNIYVTGNGNALTTVTLSEDGKTVSFTKDKNFADQAEMSAYKAEVNQTIAEFKNEVKEQLKHFVTLDTEQEITAVKHFIEGVTIGSNKHKFYERDGVLWLEGDIAITGGITIYATENVDVSTIMDGVVVDEITITKGDDNVLRVKDAGAGSSFDENAMWSALASSSDKQINKTHLTTALTGYATESWVSGKNYAVKATTLAGYGITDAPTKTGSGASGTWGINISGNANNADKLDNYHESDFFRINRGTVNSTEDSSLYRLNGTIVDTSTTGWNGMYAGFCASGSVSALVFRVLGGEQGMNKIYMNYSVDGSRWGDAWRIIATTDSNVNSATKLQTARTLWGKSFDGTGNISGDLTGVGKIKYNNGEYFDEYGNMHLPTSLEKNYWTVINSNGAELIKVNGIGGIIGSSFRADNWYRSTGNTGWQNETYGGGWYMSDSNFIRSFQNKSVYIGSGSYVNAGGNAYSNNLGNISEPNNCRYVSETTYNIPTGYIHPFCGWSDSAASGWTTSYVIGSIRNYANNWGEMYFGIYQYEGASRAWKAYMRLDGANRHLYIDGNLMVTGGGTFYGSDIRYKSIVQQIKLSLLDIAKAPSFVYRWNKKEMICDRLNIGGSAQYTQTILPWAVEEKNNLFTMDYATVAYTFAVHTARHLLDYETKTDKEIRKLKNRIKYLEKQLKSLHYEEANIVDN